MKKEVISAMMLSCVPCHRTHASTIPAYSRRIFQSEENVIERIGGKLVSTVQLENIYDLYMVLTDVTLVKNKLGIGSFTGILDCISKTPVKITKPNSTIVYHDSYEREENCEYE